MEYALLLILMIVGAILKAYGLWLLLGTAVVSAVSGYVSHASGGNWKQAARKSATIVSALCLGGVLIAALAIVSNPAEW